MARTDPQVNFRIPADLNDKIKAAAEKNNRTITAELVSRLDSTFQPLETSRSEEVEELIAKTVHQAIGVTIRSLQESGWKPPDPGKNVSRK